MCGICGFTGAPDDLLLQRMAHSILHRGPDEEGYFSDDGVNLAIRRLSIIDVSTGHQPVHNEDKTVWAIFNGEIYNFQELREELAGKGHRFATHHSDTETIVHLYEEHGEDFLDKLNGMFAIALWDKRESKLFLARDRMGVKPLFYTITGGKLIFGSEIKAILLHPDVSASPDYNALYHYFSFKNIPSPMTAFDGIYSLNPGEIISFSRGNITKRRWWRIQFNEDTTSDENTIQERIRSLLEDATRIRMISDVPIGAYLSGGVDSSSVVAFMSRHSGAPVKTFALGYEDDLANKEADLFYARKVSDQFGTEHHEYIMSHQELLDEMDNIVRAFDQPFSGVTSTYFLSKLICKHVKVALTGDGADELFGSYLSHRVARPIDHMARLYQKVAADELTNEDRALFAPCDVDFVKKLYEESGGDEAAWRHILTVFRDSEKDELLTGKFKALAKSEPSLDLIRRHFDSATATRPLNRVLEMEWNTQLADQVLAFVDFLSMAHSVEARSPFLDYRLVEYVATIPEELKIRNGVVKDILKKSVAPILPHGIVDRPKEGFVLPVFDWMVTKMKDYSSMVLSEEQIGRHGLIDPGYVRELLYRYKNGDKHLAGKVWNVVNFQIWWEKYFG